MNSFFTSIDDWKLHLEAARQGDANSIGLLFEAMRDYLLATAERDLPVALRSKLGASDIVQQSFSDAQKGLPGFRGDSTEELRVWMRRIIRNNVIDAVRRYHHTQARDVSKESAIADDCEPQPYWDETPSRIVSRDEALDALGKAVAQLPRTQQLIIQYRHRDGLSHAAIAQRLGMSVVSVRKTASRALQNLRHSLSTFGSEA